MIVVIDYDAGNIGSVEKALSALGENPVVSREKEVILKADKVILPGVGSFGTAMTKIRSYGLEPVISQVIERGTPFLGICLGLQLLFERSEECEGVNGLGILKGIIRRIPQADGLKIPHIGWNSLSFPHQGTLFQGIEEGAFVYFVHSYYLQAQEEEIVTATSEYGTLIHASIQRKNLYACQFHPEKSAKVGLKILENFIHIAREDEACIPKE